MQHYLIDCFIEEKPLSKLNSDKKKRQHYQQSFKNKISVFRSKDLIKGPVKMRIIFWFKLSNQKHDMDLDNLLAVVLNSLTGIFYEDDRQVVEIHARKEINKHLEGISLKIYK